jgi:hypothetical protein
MDNSDNNILISAYLDNELTVEERARADHLLATNAEARQLLEELRALRGGLQELPQFRLEIDFAQSVLQKAQQALADAQSPKNISTESTTPVPSLLMPSRSWRRIIHLPFGTRGIAWSLVAVAAAVLIMVTTNQSDQNRQLGRPAADRAIVRIPAKPEHQTAEQSKLVLDRVENAPIAKTAPGAENSLVVDESSGNRRIPPGKSQDIVSNNEHQSSAAPSENKELPALQPNTHLATEGSDFFKAPVDGSESLALPSGSGGKLAIQDQRSAVKLRKSNANPSVAGSALDSSYPGGQQLRASEFRPVLIVHANISPDAARRRAFDQLLSKNDIALAEDNQKTHYDFDQKVADGKQLGAALPGANGLDLIYVEAAPAQIESTLADLRNAPQLFSSVTVTNLQRQTIGKDGPTISFSGGTIAGEGLPVQINALSDKIEESRQQANKSATLLGRAERLSVPSQTLQINAEPPVGNAMAREKSTNGGVPADVEKSGDILETQGVSKVGASSPAPAHDWAPPASDTNQQPSSTAAPSAQDPAPSPQRALFVLRIVNAANESDSAKPAPANGFSSPVQSPAILPAGK